MAAAISMLLAAVLQLAPPGGSAAERLATSRPAGTRPDRSATSFPASQPDDPLIASLIADLGSTDFRKRTAAQQRLAELGPAARPSLILHINDPSPEIAERVQAIVQPPADPDMRVDLAVALLATRRPETMERGVYMMFDTPELCCEPFLARVPAMQGRDRVVGEAIAEQFRTWRGHYQAFQRNYEKTRKRDEASAARIRKLQTDGNVVHAEAAFQLAIEALETTDVDVGNGRETTPSTQPAGNTRLSPASQRS